MIDLVVATGNAHKLSELRTMLAALPVRVLSLREFADEHRVVEIAMPEETGETFAANADLKAIHVARMSGSMALADDSGFEVPALEDRPGVISARYAGATGTPAEIDRANNHKLIAEARAARLFGKGTPPIARFRSVLSVALADGVIACRGSGSVDGVLVEEERGTGGFGYDPHFLVPALGRTFAEIEPAGKNRISHRARALIDLLRSLGPLLKTLETRPSP